MRNAARSRSVRKTLSDIYLCCNWRYYLYVISNTIFYIIITIEKNKGEIKMYKPFDPIEWFAYGVIYIFMALGGICVLAYIFGSCSN